MSKARAKKAYVAPEVVRNDYRHRMIEVAMRRGMGPEEAVKFAQQQMQEQAAIAQEKKAHAAEVRRARRHMR
jgi:hypothetical protein